MGVNEQLKERSKRLPATPPAPLVPPVASTRTLNPLLLTSARSAAIVVLQWSLPLVTGHKIIAKSVGVGPVFFGERSVLIHFGLLDRDVRRSWWCLGFLYVNSQVETDVVIRRMERTATPSSERGHAPVLCVQYSISVSRFDDVTRHVMQVFVD